MKNPINGPSPTRVTSVCDDYIREGIICVAQLTLSHGPTTLLPLLIPLEGGSDISIFIFRTHTAL